MKTLRPPHCPLLVCYVAPINKNKSSLCVFKGGQIQRTYSTTIVNIKLVPVYKKFVVSEEKKRKKNGLVQAPQ